MIKNATCTFILNSVYEKYASSKEAFFVPPVPLLNNNVTLEGKKKYRPNVFSPLLNAAVYCCILNSWFLHSKEQLSS